MIRAIHWADYHLGVKLGSMDPVERINGRILDFLDAFDAMVEYAQDNGANLALFAGDGFHNSNPDHTLLNLFAERLTKLATICPVVLVPGNHDMPGSYGSTSVDIFHTLNLPNVIVGRGYEVFDIETDGGVVQIATFPYPMKSKLLGSKRLSKEESDIELSKECKKLLLDLAATVDDSAPAILVGHMAVEGSVYGVERSLTIGNVSEIPLEFVANPVYDYVALGHIHRFQNLTEGVKGLPSVVYSGPLERIDFSEENMKTGFIWLEINGETTWEFVETDSRPMITIDINVPDDKKYPNKYVMNKLDQYSEDIKSAIIRVRIYSHSGMKYGNVIGKLMEMGAYCVSGVQVVTPRIPRVLSGVEYGTMLSSLSHNALVKEYLKDKGIKGKELRELVELSGEIMDRVMEETE